MISLTRLNGIIYYINPELIQTVESTPDTIVTLVNNTKFLVKESPEEIAERFVEYKRRIQVPFMSDKLAE